MNIVVLDGHTVNPGDLSWDPVESLGSLTKYDRTPEELVVARSLEAEILLVNKVTISHQHISDLPRLKCICLLATGFDNVDISAAKTRDIKVFNAVGYGTESVAQHTLAMMLAYNNRVGLHAASVKAGEWSAQDDFSYSLNTVTELNGKTLGIIGFGKIGRRVGELAAAFGMQVITTSSSILPQSVKKVFIDDLFKSSHFITLHVPLTEGTKEIIDKRALSLMSPDTVIINTGRGALINEDNLAVALLSGQVKGAVLDVLTTEPPPASHPLIHLPQVMITPHMAWRSKEARNTLIKIVAQNIQDFLDGKFKNSLA